MESLRRRTMTGMSEDVYSYYDGQYFTIEVPEDLEDALANTYIYFGCAQSTSSYYKTIQVSKDGINWTSKKSSIGGIEIALLSKGEKLYIKANNTTYNTGNVHHYFGSNGPIIVSGNIMSLMYGDNFVGKTEFPSTSSSFYGLFNPERTNSNYNIDMYVTDASNLILPATTLTVECYSYMFYDNRRLLSAPTLPANILTAQCYNYMFYNCRILNYIKMLATDISANNCLTLWVRFVSSTGTFVKNSEATWNKSSVIPTGWIVETANS